MKNRNRIFPNLPFLFVLMMLFAGSCQLQDDWLNVKRDKSDISPKSLDDLQAVLDNSNTMNRGYPMLGMTGTDNLYLPDNILGSVSQRERNAYSWAKDIYQGGPTPDFNQPYIVSEYCNIVLDALVNLAASQSQKTQAANIKGQALFHRAMSLYNLSQLFCKPYQPATAAQDLGLQLKTSSDPNEKTKRSSVKETYAFMIADLKQAATLLPQKQQFTTRPSRAAALALLSKIYLSMQDYKNAAQVSALSLGENPPILDFNSTTVKPAATFVFPAYSNQHANQEIIFYAYGQTLASLWPVNTVGFADTALFKSYHKDDLRKSLFFKMNSSGLAKFTGSYTGANYNFSGLAVNEILLVQAESLARTGQSQKAKDLLDELLLKRYKTGSYQKMQTGDQQLLIAILAERRKELPFTGQLRWEDLRRLNQDPAFAKTLVRTLKGEKFELLPNDNKYVFPLPDQEIQLSNVQQNNR